MSAQIVKLANLRPCHAPRHGGAPLSLDDKIACNLGIDGQPFAQPLEADPQAAAKAGQVISLAKRKKAKGEKGVRQTRKPADKVDTWNHPRDNNEALTRVLLHRCAINLGLSLTAEDYGFLHRYGHLAP